MGRNSIINWKVCTLTLHYLTIDSYIKKIKLNLRLINNLRLSRSYLILTLYPCIILIIMTSVMTVLMIQYLAKNFVFKVKANILNVHHNKIILAKTIAILF